MAYAHSENSAGNRHDLVEHLLSVATKAREHADKFGAGDLAYWAGLWHDLGKFHPDFQTYLIEAEAGQRQRGPDHKGAGATLALSQCQPLTLLIQGHHGGLPSRAEAATWLRERGADPRTAAALTLAQAAITPLEPPIRLPLPAFTTQPPANGQPPAAELFLRLLFSALVDADFLDTERHFQADQAEARGGATTLGTLLPIFEADQSHLTGRPGLVNQVRDDVYRACLAATQHAPGFFRLTVPTGGGKTRSSLAFALGHAVHHDLRRIVVAIPYTSITDQTATVYRAIFGDERAVLEHHSAIQAHEATEGKSTADWQRLAAENWDAPLVVTTTVQLFESLMGRTPTACRKLHNLTGSIIILDEAQTLPSSLLRPILDVLRELVAHYRVSVVFCTATQPALDERAGFPGLPDVRDIIADPAPLFQALRRVDCHLPAPNETWTWDQVAEVVRAETRCLTVLNTRRDALALLDALDDPDAFHLSTLLCGAHRSVVLAEVKARLEQGRPVRLVSTQVIEAGVDIDFPVVLRALGPLDRIVQAAGRCNREGRLPAGRVIVFQPTEGHLPPGDYETATDIATVFLREAERDLHDPAIITAYFQRLYGNLALDSKGIQMLRAAFDYPQVATTFKFINDDTTPVVVPYRPAAKRIDGLLAQLRGQPARARTLLRRLQPYIVAIANRDLPTYQAQGLVSEIVTGLWQWHGRYDPVRGLTVGPADPAALVW